MKITNIKQFPTSLSTELIKERLNNCNGFHESLLRSFQTLQKVKELLELNTPTSVILEIIEEIESPNQAE
jgi:hypothetical protein